LADRGFRDAAERLGDYVRKEAGFAALVAELEELPSTRR
jgi:hypothetical protein